MPAYDGAKRGGSPRLPRAILPVRDEFGLPKETDNVEREVVADAQRDDKFHQHDGSRARPDGNFPCRDKSEHHPDGVEHGIDDAVAGVALRERLLAIVVDHHRRVFENLPAGLESDGARKTQNELEQEIKRETVNDVGERVPIGKVLGIAGTFYDAFPQFHVTALADRWLTEREQHERLPKNKTYSKGNTLGGARVRDFHRGSVPQQAARYSAPLIPL